MQQRKILSNGPWQWPQSIYLSFQKMCANNTNLENIGVLHFVKSTLCWNRNNDEWESLSSLENMCVMKSSSHADYCLWWVIRAIKTMPWCCFSVFCLDFVVQQWILMYRCITGLQVVVNIPYKTKFLQTLDVFYGKLSYFEFQSHLGLVTVRSNVGICYQKSHKFFKCLAGDRQYTIDIN